MAKQPYIPFYIGDYIRDTRMLPLNVRGAWVELIIQSWDNNGEISGTIPEFARLMSCNEEEANLVIQMLNQKKIFDYADLGNGVVKITVRKIVKMIDISNKRKNAGIKGGNPNLVKQVDNQMVKLNTEYENEVDNDNINVFKEKGVKGEKDIEERRKDFYENVGLNFSGQYEKTMLLEFCDYWTEHGDMDKKMRFEKENTFGLTRRLSTWKKNEGKFSKNNKLSNRPETPAELLARTMKMDKDKTQAQTQ